MQTGANASTWPNFALGWTRDEHHCDYLGSTLGLRGWQTSSLAEGEDRRPQLAQGLLGVPPP
jgi:hypothetical protein